MKTPTPAAAAAAARRSQPKPFELPPALAGGSGTKRTGFSRIREVWLEPVSFSLHNCHLKGGGNSSFSWKPSPITRLLSYPTGQLKAETSGRRGLKKPPPVLRTITIPVMVAFGLLIGHTNGQLVTRSKQG